MIEAAMQAEQQYLTAKLAGEAVALDLTPYGYAELEDYFADKRDYRLRHCGVAVQETTMAGIAGRVEAAVQSGTPSLWIPTAESVFVWHGSDALDRELCAELFVRVYDMNYIGGTIVSGPEDLSFALIVPEGIDISTSYMLSKIKGIMDGYLGDVVIDGNDILVGGKKVLGSMNRRVNGVYVFACQISYADRSEYISRLCTKPVVKTPGCVDGARLPKSVLKNEVIACLQ